MSTLRFERGTAMVRRVRLETGFAQGDDAAARVAAALAEALRSREAAAIDDDHDPRYLHPARTVLILLSDAGCRAADTLMAACFVDSVDAALVPPPAVVRTVAGAGAAELCAAVPLPSARDEDDGLEALVSAEPDAALIALAEQLDQVRHLRFRPDLDWPLLHGRVERVYAPVAHRICPPIGRRFDRWADAFRSRLLTR